MPLSKGFDLGNEFASDMAQQRGRGDRLAAMGAQKAHQTSTVLEIRDIAVEVKAVQIRVGA